MDFSILQLVVFVGATFVASVVAGVSGFAFALIAASVWLHVLTPIQTATLITGYAMIVQGYGAWKMRYATKWDRVWPFLIGGAPGVVVGVLVLHWANPAAMRTAIGVLITLYAVYALARPSLKPVPGGTPADVGVGFLSGILGATTGFAGILIVIWCQMRGWPRDAQRGVFQPASVAMLAMCALALGASGSISRDTVQLYFLGLPALAAPSARSS